MGGIEGSSWKILRRLEALLSASDCGVKCSATQCGFRVKRLNEDKCEGVARMSETGPREPY